MWSDFTNSANTSNKGANHERFASSSDRVVSIPGQLSSESMWFLP